MNKKILGATAAAAVLVATGLFGASSASAATAGRHHDPLPPKGARAVVHVSPNPTTEPRQEITITGHCVDGAGLKMVLGGFPENPIFENIKIVNADPKGFLATANLRDGIGHGAGPVFVDCGQELGVTLLVTHPS